MSYRKRVPAASGLSTAQRLKRVCNAASGLPFQSHNAIVLLNQLRQQNSAQYEKFMKQVNTQGFFPSRLVSSKDLKEKSTLYKLPLPRHLIDQAEASEEELVPRTFYHASDVRNPEEVAKVSTYLPRCGLSGLFYSREEVVDNLQAAAMDLGFRNQFWIARDHPGIKSGFLTIKEGSEAICIPLTSNVISIDHVEPFSAQLLHPSLQSSTTAARSPAFFDVSGVERPGMNAISGTVSLNPHIQKLPSRGVWLSHDQLLQFDIKVKKAAGSMSELFALAEVEQWELYNAEQLVVPGRLGLRRCLGEQPEGEVFHPM